MTFLNLSKKTPKKHSSIYNICTKNPQKKHRELKNLYELLKCQFRMYSAGVHPSKKTGTQLINGKSD